MTAAWFKLPVPIENLPVLPAPTAPADPAPANSIAAPVGFDPANPGNIWDSLPTNGSDTYPLELTPSRVVLPYQERMAAALVTRHRVMLLVRDYRLTLPVISATVVSRHVMVATQAKGWRIGGQPLGLEVTGQTGAIQRSYSITGQAATVAAQGRAAAMRMTFILQGAAGGVVAQGAAGRMIGPGDRVLGGQPASLAITGQAAAILRGSGITGQAGALALQGRAADASYQQPSLPPFNTLLYAGTSAPNAITGAGFRPGLVWMKRRDGTADHRIFDKVRGTGKYWGSNGDGGQTTDAFTLTSFDADGFTVMDAGGGNGSGFNYVAWCWKEGGAPAANNDGTIAATVSVNAAAGYSIITYTGTGANGTIGHGLGVQPAAIIIKQLTAGTGWPLVIFPAVVGDNKYMVLNQTGNPYTDSSAYKTSNSSVISVGNFSFLNEAGNSYVAYAFASVPGVSKVGTYTGNGGTLTVSGIGFAPSFVLVKATGATSQWVMYDSKRNGRLRANSGDAELSPSGWSAAADSFTVTQQGDGVNANGDGLAYVYLAFA